MKKKPVILDELQIWFQGRFTLTGEEKLWLLLVLIICWTGLLGRYFYLHHPSAPQPIPAENVLRP